MASPRFAFLDSSGVNVDFDDETSVLECFQKFIDEDMFQLFAEQKKYMTTNFWQQILIGNHDPKLEVGWIQTMNTLIGLLILQGNEQ